MATWSWLGGDESSIYDNFRGRRQEIVHSDLLLLILRRQEMPFVLTLQRFYGNNDTHQHSGTGSEYQQSSGALLLRRVCRDKPRLNLYNFPSQGNPKRSFSKQTIPINRSSPYKYLDKNPITSRNPRKLQSSIHTRIQFLEHLRKLIFKAGPK